MDNLEAINSDIYAKASVNREHIFAFLRLQTTSDADTLKARVKAWLEGLHDDPYYSKIYFPTESNIDGLGVNGDALSRVLDDLSSYGRVTHDTIIDAPDTTLPEINTQQDPVV